MPEDDCVALLRKARQLLDSYLYDDLEPHYEDIVRLCAKIDEALPLAEHRVPLPAENT
jgi:hypothetical protein